MFRHRNDHDAARAALMREIARDAVATAGYTGRAVFSARVMAAMAKVERHLFVAPAQEELAYVNGPLPIGHGQTISQPYIVALMTELIEPEPGDVVLEIGTGSGYQAAVLAELVSRVHSIEVVPALAREAAARLARLGYDNVEVKAGDGALGWPDRAPFDAILVTAAAPTVPPALIEQLKPGGRLVVPVGRQHEAQTLTVIDKDHDGRISERAILPVAFVPLTGERG